VEHFTLEDQKYWPMIDLEAQIQRGDFATGLHRHQHVLVDEFQDINVLDLNFLKGIAGWNKAELTVVGDDDQAIYEWRGASPQFILHPEKYMGLGYETHVLDMNYRSPRNIVELSQRLIKNNKNRVDKNVRASTDDCAEVSVLRTPSLNLTVELVSSLVRRFLEDQSVGKIAIIGRKRSQIIPYQIVFASSGTPFYAAEDLQIFLSDAFNDLKDMLVMKTRPPNESRTSGEIAQDLIKLCNKIKRYPLSKSERDQLSQWIFRGNPQSMDQALSNLLSYRGPLKGANQRGRMSSDFCERIRSFFAASLVSESIERVSQDFTGLQKDYGKAVEDIFYTDPPFLYLTDYAQRYGNDHTSFLNDMERSISVLANVPPEYEDSQEDDYVRKKLHLMTALRAKGKEFDVVFVLDVNEDIWPSKLANSTAQFEQERRVFYVGITRARKKLFLLVNRTILGEGAMPSRYLSEMGLTPRDVTNSPGASAR
jgi:DNA helicase-2/ATP-dependent DNA helicase PcrA